MSQQPLEFVDLAQTPEAENDQPPPYSARRGRRPVLNRLTMETIAQVMENPFTTIIARTHVRGLIIPARGGPAVPVMIAVDYDTSSQPPIPRVVQEFLGPFLDGPTLFVDLQVLCGEQDTHLRVFRQDRPGLPVNRAIHCERQPQAPWRGDVLVLGRGHLFFYDHVSPRFGSYIARALEISGECCIRAGVQLAM